VESHTNVAIQFIFPKSRQHLEDFEAVIFIPQIFALRPEDPPEKLEEEFVRAYAKGLAHARKILQSMIQEIETFWSNGREIRH
jgi:hypothetical protein